MKKSHPLDLFPLSALSDQRECNKFPKLSTFHNSLPQPPLRNPFCTVGSWPMELSCQNQVPSYVLPLCLLRSSYLPDKLPLFPLQTIVQSKWEKIHFPLQTRSTSLRSNYFNGDKWGVNEEKRINPFKITIWIKIFNMNFISSISFLAVLLQNKTK